MPRPAPAGIRCLLALGAFLWGACDQKTAVILEVVGSEDLSDVDTLIVDVYAANSDVPLPLLAGRQQSVTGLPSRLEVLAEQTAGSTVRFRVTGLTAGLPRAAGDRLFQLPAGGSARETLALTPQCASVACLRLQQCNPLDTAGGCDGTCLNSEECSGLLGCAPESSCDRVADAELGVCSGTGVDADGDGAGDARCPLQAAGGDCDDTSSAALPGAPARCGAGRDHDCDGLVDDLGACATACDFVVNNVSSEPQARVLDVPLGGVITALATPRNDQASLGLGQTVIYAAVENPGEQNQTRIIRVVIDETGNSAPEESGQLSLPGAARVNQLVLAGPLLVAATDGGLLLVLIRPDGGIQAAGPMFPILPGGVPSKLCCVAVEGNTAWVGGDNLPLAAVDIGRPQAPQLLGFAGGTSARPPRSLARVQSGVVAATGLSAFSPGDDPQPTGEPLLLFYDAPGGARPGEATPLALDPPEDALDPQTAVQRASLVASQRGTPERVAVAASVGSSNRAHVLLLTRNPARGFVIDPAFENQVATPVAIHLNGGFLMAATLSGAITVTTPERGGVPATVARGGATGELASFAATLFDGRPRVAVGLGSNLRLADFPCAPVAPPSDGGI